MTAPINFPNIAPPQLVQSKNQLDGFGEFLLALQGQRADRAAKREQLDMQRMKLESDLETDKLTRTQKLKENELAGLREEAKEFAAPFVLSFTMLGKDGNEVTALQQARQMHEQNTNKKLTPYIDEAFALGVKQQQEGLAAVAQRRGAESDATTSAVGANVATQTEAGKISKANSEAKVQRDTEAAQIAAAKLLVQHTQAQLNFASLQATLARDEINLDPARRSQISTFMEHGKTLGEAYTAVGRQVPAGADPDMKLDATGGAGGQADRKQKGLAAQALSGSMLIEAAGNRPLGMAADAFRQMLGSTGITGAVGRSLTNKHLTPEDRQVIQGYQLMGQAYAVHVTGATATDQQMNVFNNTIITFKDDDPATQQQKLAMRRIVPRLIQSGLDPVDIVDAMIAEGLRVGMSKDKIKILQAQKPFAAKHERSVEYQQGVKNAPATRPDASNTDPAIAAAFRAAGPPR